MLGHYFSLFLRDVQWAIDEKRVYDIDRQAIEWGVLSENKNRAERLTLTILTMVLSFFFLLLYAEFGAAGHPVAILSFSLLRSRADLSQPPYLLWLYGPLNTT